MPCSTATVQSFPVPAYVPPTPAPPATVTVSGIQVTGPNTWTANVTWTASTGATSYTVLLDGQAVKSGITGTSGTVSGTNPGQTHQVGVAACN